MSAVMTQYIPNDKLAGVCFFFHSTTVVSNLANKKARHDHMTNLVLFIFKPNRSKFLFSLF